MTKKIFAMFLAVLMVLSVLPISAMAAELTCPGSGKHTAKNCNNTVLSVIEPTCKEAGFTVYKCNDCEEEFHDNLTLPTGEHDYVAAPDKAPTCEEEGYTGALKCSKCGDVKGETKIPSLSAGKYNCKWEVQNPEIDCLTGGTQTWKCVTCGAEKTVIIDKKPAHSWGEFELVTEATKDVPGLAKRSCDCGAVDEVIVYYSHDCKAHLITIKGYPKTCTTDGLAEHTECRICGTKYNKEGTKKLSNSQIAKLTEKAGHTFAKDPTCADTLLQCTICGQWVNPGIEHDIDWEVKEDEKAQGAEYVAPTCLKPGHIYDVCANCNKRDLKTLAPLGHKLVEVDVPSSCASIGYTFTYCTRVNCDDSELKAVATDKNGTNHDVMVEGYAPVTELPSFEKAEDRVLGGFYLALKQDKADTYLYFTGKMNEKWLDASNNVAEAVQVYLERLHVGLNNQYYLFFYNADGVKTYIDLEVSSKFNSSNVEYGTASIKLTTQTPKAVFAWNDTYQMLVSNEMVCSATCKDSFFLGTYNTFETISASSFKEFATKSGQYFAKLCTVGAKQKVQLTSVAFNYDAGLNSSNHAHNLAETVLVPAGCEVDGAGEYRCTACGWSESFVIPAGHNYVPQYTGKVNNEPAYKAPSCVAGYVYEVCSCNKFQKVVLPGYGHVMGTEQKPVLDHTHTGGYKHTDCVISDCTYRVNGAYMTWEGVGKVYDSWSAANADHGYELSASGVVINKGDCNTAKRTQYKCNCGVWVVVEEIGAGFGIHKDLLSAGKYVAPTCVADGGFYTFFCTDCKSYVGTAPYSAEPTEDNWNTVKALGHDYKAPDNHASQHNACDDPDYNEIHLECQRCTADTKDHYVYCFVKDDEVTVSTAAGKGEDLCDTTVMEYYFCAACNDYHFRSFVKEMGHVWQPVTNDKGEIVYTVEPKCDAPGSYNVKCAICGDVEERVAAPIAHENKAGQKFFNKCTDTVTDRHCVKCCKCAILGSAHDCLTNKVNGEVKPCACVIPADHQYNEVKMPSTCTMPPYMALTCADCGHRTNKVMTEINGEKVDFCGHKPVAIDKIPEIGEDGKPTGNMVEVRYPGFIYDEYEYIYYVVENGEWVKKTETYTAKFIERKAATYAEDGYDLFECAICKSQEKNLNAKLTGLGFEMDIVNANGQDGFGFGSLIEVYVNINSLEESIYSFRFNIPVPTGLTFVGFEKINDDFVMTVTDPAKVVSNGNQVSVVGSAAFDVSGKMQNVAITEKTGLVKMLFRVTTANDAASEVTFRFNQTFTESVKDAELKQTEQIMANYKKSTIEIRGFLDFNGDGVASANDMYLAMSLLTGEHPDGLTYDVTVDMNKDGQITLEDLSIAYGYVVGNYSKNELLKLGMSDAEQAMLRLNEVKTCNSSACGKPIPADVVHCPFCGNHQ